MNKISVFGSSGFIGSKFCELYKNDIIRIDRNDYVPKSNDVLYLISTVDNYNIQNSLHIDIDVNLKVLMNVLENVKDNKNITFNFVSSWFVYGKTTDLPFSEDKSKCSPTGFYSITKHCAEQLLISFCETYGINYRIFRLANVLGIGDTKVSKKKNALQYLIKKIVDNEQIELYNGGDFLRDYIDVEDVACAMRFLMKNAPKNEIINIGSGVGHKFSDLIQIVIDYSESASKVVDISPTHFHKIVQVKDSYLDTTKLKYYGYESKIDIKETIKNLVDFYKKQKYD